MATDAEMARELAGDVMDLCVSIGYNLGGRTMSDRLTRTLKPALSTARAEGAKKAQTLRHEEIEAIVNRCTDNDPPFGLINQLAAALERQEGE